jgi:hypothetical protein
MTLYNIRYIEMIDEEYKFLFHLQYIIKLKKIENQKKFSKFLHIQISKQY